MPFEPLLRTDILDDSLTTASREVQVIAETQYKQITHRAQARSTTPGPSKNIVEVMDLVKIAIEDYESREDKISDARVRVTYEKPDRRVEETGLEIISISLERREPGAFGEGSPFEAKTRNLRPMLREEVEDPDNPGYRRAVLGFFYDNVLRLTCWARTNKAANDRALWLENVIEEYTWFLRSSGVGRFLYQGRAAEEAADVLGTRLYGRPIDYFVRTEKLRSLSQKELELIVVRLQRQIGST
jgi:hypothetical protein